jgi:hypothetical protein
MEMGMLERRFGRGPCFETVTQGDDRAWLRSVLD